jgi:parallel beta-helix repeat protein
MYRRLSLIVVVVCTLFFCGMTQAAGLDVTAPGDTIRGVPNDGVTDGSRNFGWPAWEHPALAIDDNISTKYLHFKGEIESTGFRVTPSASQTIVVGLTFTTANDAVGRDPVAYELYGSNVSINGPYTLISSGDIVDFSQATPWPRFTMNETPVFFDNDVAYDHYQVLFTAVRNPGSANSMQISEVELLGKDQTAANPDPFDGAVIRDTWVNLSWLPGDSTYSHDVYFGENFAEVYRGTGGTFRGNQALNHFLIGLHGYPYPDGLVTGTTYYWRIDEVEADRVTRHRGDIWSFFILSGKAYDPVPGDGEGFIDTDVTLTWEAGRGAQTHTVYFGDNPDAVEDALGGTPQTLSRYYPGELEFDKTYYWRVDEFDDAVTHRGEVWSFTTMSADEFWAAAYYVDGGNRAADDGNPGTEARPFKTIGRGVQSLQPGDSLLIKAGNYREGVILQRSGTQAQPIRIQAYPGDEGKVIINAAEPVTNWRKCTGPGDCAGNPYWNNIYYADVGALVRSHPDSGFAVRQVFQNGELLERSRYPDEGWHYPSEISDPKKKFTDSSLSKPDGYFVGSVCHVKTFVGQIDQIPITDFSQRAITLAESPWYDIKTRYGYYITSIVGEINEEGEWAYDPSQKKIFLWPRGDVAEGVEITYRDYCVRTYSGTGWNVLRGLAMHNAYKYGVWLRHANDMTIENNTIEHTFTFGIHLQTTGAVCNNNRILNNTIKHPCYCGINVGGDAWHCRVEGNYVYAPGTEHYGGDLMNGPSYGIYISGPFAKVYNNRIDHTGYKALYLAGHTLGREVSNNYITNVGLALAESGGIYTAVYDKPEKDHIHHNIFENVFGCQMMDRRHDKGLPVTIEKYSGNSSGICVDERGNNRIIEHNTVINSHMTGILFHWAPGNVVRNNTLYGNKVTQIWFNGRNQPGEKLVDEVVLDNIMFATDAQQKTFYLGIHYDDVHFGQSDRNYFYNPYRTSHIFLSRYSGGTVQDDMSLQRWRALSGYDANSKEFSYLDQFDDITIDSPIKSRIIYNTSLDVINIDLESEKYCDVDGNKMYGSVSLQPFESKILIFADYEIP